MAPRDIPISRKAFQKLLIDKAWFRGYTEKQLEGPITRFIADTDYDNYIIASDDLVPTQKALDVVEQGLESHETFTGWCNISPQNQRANVRLTPFPGSRTFFIVTHGISQLQRFTNWFKVLTFPLPEELPDGGKPFRTYFMGFAFTGMRRELWMRFPFRTYANPTNHRGNGSDYMASDRLRKADIPMWSQKEAFFYHLANHAEGVMLVGKVKPHLFFESQSVS